MVVDREEREVRGVGALIRDFLGVSVTLASFLRLGVELVLDKLGFDAVIGSLCRCLAVTKG